MNNKTVEVIGILFIIAIAFVTIILLASTSFAFIGWILLSFANMFGAGMVISYFNCTITGLVLGIVLRVISK